MSGDSKKPVITRAGKTAISTPVENKKLSYFEKRRKARELKRKKRRAEDAKTREEILHRQKKQKAPITTEVKTPVLVTSKKEKKAKSKPIISKSQKKWSEKSKSTAKAKKKKSRDRKSSERRKIYAVVSITVLLLLVGLGVAKQNRPSSGQISSDSTSSALLGESDAPEGSSDKPGFVTINPRTSAGDLRSHYDPDKGFYTFQEELFGKLITVNQQPVPDKFVLSADVLLAQTEYSTIGRFETDKGTVYVARLENDDYHSVAFTFRGLLVFITSTKNITDSQWTEYINSL